MSERWPAVALSVLLHAALLAALLYGWLLHRRPARPTPTLAIEATVVDARSLARTAPAAKVAPPPAPAAAQPPPPPQPSAEELAQRERQRAAEAAAVRAREAAQRETAQREAAQHEAAQREAAQREVARKAQAEADARKAQAEADARKRAQEEARQRALEEQQRREDEAALRQSIASEEQAAAARAGPALASWQAAIAARVTRAWIRPPTARPGIECRINVTQVPGGEVVGVRIMSCNGDQAVRESIEAAVYRASPLPPPPDPALFDRNLVINFKPD